MEKLRTHLGIAVLMVAALVVTSCENTKQESTQGGEDHAEMNHENMNDSNSGLDNETASSETMSSGDEANLSAEVIVSSYLELKDALVADNSQQAAEAGKKLVAAFEGFDVEKYEAGQQQELHEIIADAKEHAEHIAESEIDHQREHFVTLSIDIADMVAITGAPKTLYQQYCPMYNNNKGGMWLSASKEIKNPYFGAKMLNCGEVQKEI